MKDEDPTSAMIFFGAIIGLIITLLVMLIWDKVKNKPKKDEFKPLTEILIQNDRISDYNGEILVFTQKTKE